MHDEDIRRRSLAPAHEDEIVERSVLTEVLFLHPAQLTILELALRVEADQRSCEQDAVERAVRELARDGLIPGTAAASRPAGPLCALTSCSGASIECRGPALRCQPGERPRAHRHHPGGA